MATRREFTVRSSLGLAALSAGAPAFLARSAAAAAGKSDGRALVVVELAGGNDGLNTVIPFGDPLYRRNRPGVGIPDGVVLKLDKYVGFHPAMTGFKKLWDDGRLAVVQGVGYPNPNRSHFRSMDIWQSARPEEVNTQDGWLGRSLDARADRLAGRTPAVSIGGERLPLALLARRVAAPAIASLDEFRIGVGSGDNVDLRRRSMVALASDSAGSDDLSFLRRTSASAFAAATRVEDVAKSYKPAAEYPNNHLGRCLKSVAQLIAADFGAEIYYVSLGGFDTHSQQQNVHAALLGELSSAVAAFVADLAGHKLDNRVLLATFSEFGRRVKENGSLGTDHGAASQMFVVRPKGWKTGKAGLVGKHPSLTDLDDGDLKHHTDFRAVYASMLDRWLQADSVGVLGKKFKHVEFV